MASLHGQKWWLATVSQWNYFEHNACSVLSI